MKELFEKTVLFGMGLFSYSKEKIEQVVDEMVQRGELQREEAKEVVDSLWQRGREQKEKIENMVSRIVHGEMKEYPTKEDIRTIIREELRHQKVEEMMEKRPVPPKPEEGAPIPEVKVRIAKEDADFNGDHSL